MNTQDSDESPSGRPGVYTADEAAVILKCSADWLKRRAAARKIPFTMLGGSYRFSNAHLKEIIRLNEHLPAGCLQSALPASAEPARPRRTRQEIAGDADVMPLRPRPRPDGPRRRKKNAALYIRRDRRVGVRREARQLLARTVAGPGREA